MFFAHFGPLIYLRKFLKVLEFYVLWKVEALYYSDFLNKQKLLWN